MPRAPGRRGWSFFDARLELRRLIDEGQERWRRWVVGVIDGLHTWERPFDRGPRGAARNYGWAVGSTLRRLFAIGLVAGVYWAGRDLVDLVDGAIGPLGGLTVAGLTVALLAMAAVWVWLGDPTGRTDERKRHDA